MSDVSTRKKNLIQESSFYSKKAINLYVNKVNLGIIKNANVVLDYTGPCGDTCEIYLKINERDIIEDAKFQYVGCIGSAACGSIVTQIVKKKTLEDAKEITEEEVIEDLGGLPGEECHCATLVLRTLRQAIKKYEQSKSDY